MICSEGDQNFDNAKSNFHVILLAEHSNVDEVQLKELKGEKKKKKIIENPTKNRQAG